MARERDTVCRGEERALGTSAVFGGVDEGARTREGRDGGQVQPGKRSYVHWVGLRTLAHHATGLLVVVRAPQYLRGSRSALLTPHTGLRKLRRRRGPRARCAPRCRSRPCWRRASLCQEPETGRTPLVRRPGRQPSGPS